MRDLNLGEQLEMQALNTMILNQLTLKLGQLSDEIIEKICICDRDRLWEIGVDIFIIENEEDIYKILK